MASSGGQAVTKLRKPAVQGRVAGDSLPQCGAASVPIRFKVTS
jgi:hypothetical protein